MSTTDEKYCIDANVLIQAWQKYYSPKLCPEYWNILNDFGRAGRIFLPQNVFEEIIRTEDNLTEWLKKSKIPIFEVDGDVADCLREVYANNSLHQYLVDNTKQRSLADPWVIAHALKEKACVVTKEEKVTTPNTTRIKIPNVCDNMNIRWINDFKFIEELNIRFSCTVLDK